MSAGPEQGRPSAELTKAKHCPCGSGKPYTVCCQPYLDGGEQPATAEALMRSRYCGYVLARADYVLGTWHPSSRPATLTVDEATHWLGLKIIHKEQGRPDDSAGVVEFVARYKINGKAYRLHETSRFVREGRQWFYLSSV